MDVLHFLLFLVGVLQTNYSICSPIPENWRDYIASDMLKKYEGKDLRQYPEKFFQGDIDGIDKHTLDNQLKDIFKNAITDESKRWPNGVVPYKLSEEYNKDERIVEKVLIQQAMAIIASSTGNCIQFVPRINQEDYIYITRGLSCFSSVGRQGRGQTVSFTRGCLEEIGAIQHELMHALGFYHEQSRADRDQYVWINWGNLLPGAARDFNILTDATTFGLPYDYESVLHYGFNDFANNNNIPTIVPKQKAKRIGQRSNLSILDVLKLRKAYKCPDTAEVTVDQTDLFGRNKATYIIEKSDTDPQMSIVAPTVARTKITGKRIHIRTTRPKPPNSMLPDFKKGSLSVVECTALNTENCYLEDSSNCRTGSFDFSCDGSSTNSEIRHCLEKIKQTIPFSPIRFGIGGNTELKPETFNSVSDNIVFLRIYSTNDFNCDVLSDLPLPNLLQLQFYLSTNITISHDSLRSFQKMRFLLFDESTIFSLEKGSLESLISLKTIAFDSGIAWPLSPDERSYLWRLHCSAEYSWLRDYLDGHLELIQSRKKGEIYSLPGVENHEYTTRNLFYPVDCARDNLTGDQDQVEFSVSDQGP